MESRSPDDIDTVELSDDVLLWSYREPIGASDVALNRYQIAPNARVPWGLHAHYDQEEIFVVLDGSLTFQTLEGECRVDRDEVIRFEPGSYQTAKNVTDEPVTYLAIGAPPDTEDIRIPRPCPACDAVELQLELTEADSGLRCVQCGKRLPAACPDCGADEREVRLGDTVDDLLDVCRSCGRIEPIDR